jgi:hypothetical protein
MLTNDKEPTLKRVSTERWQPRSAVYGSSNAEAKQQPVIGLLQNNELNESAYSQRRVLSFLLSLAQKKP